MVIVLPLNRVLRSALIDVQEGDFGCKVLSTLLAGFIYNMSIANFNLNEHLYEIENIDGLYGTEYVEIKKNVSIIIMRMTAEYSCYFPRKKYRDIKIKRATYTRSSLRFWIEVNDVRI